jgi:hypothetical protein
MTDHDAALREVAALVSAVLRDGTPALEAEIYPVAFRLGTGAVGSPETVERLLRRELGLGAKCLCGIGPGAPSEVIPLACPVHGTPCDECGGLEACKPGCGETCEATGTPSGTVCGRPSAGLYRAVCAHGHVRERRLCARHASSEEGLWCRDCFELDGEAAHVCDVTPVLVAEAVARAVTPGQVTP